LVTVPPRQRQAHGEKTVLIDDSLTPVEEKPLPPPAPKPAPPPPILVQPPTQPAPVGVKPVTQPVLVKPVVQPVPVKTVHAPMGASNQAPIIIPPTKGTVWTASPPQ